MNLRKLSLAFLICLLTVCPAQTEGNNALTQVSTIDAILNGLYDGIIAYGDLKDYGDFGIGTFHGLDGEMVALDGEFYQVRADGVARRVSDEMSTPFASVVFFESESEIPVQPGTTYSDLRTNLNEKVKARNIFHAVKIEGNFGYVKTRSVPGQKRPYPPLVEVTANQPTFEFNDVAGTVVGFYCPDYVGGLNVPGYHLHFLTKNKTAGGHLLEFTIKDAKLTLDYLSDIHIILPSNDEFNSLDLTKDKKKELEKAEK
ncbi:MAG: acetolactate decarboxylase [bacterium]